MEEVFYKPYTVEKIGAGFLIRNNGKIIKRTLKVKETIQLVDRLNQDVQLPTLDSTLFMIDINALKKEMMPK